jgi:carbohydrate-binding DOMON domain-containing protein
VDRVHALSCLRSAWIPALVFLLGACPGTLTLSDPTLSIRTPGGSELGVSTDYGVVFLGRTAQGGRVEITAWFGDGANIESAVIEPIGGGLYTAETEIRLPPVSISFEDPRPGSRVLLIGRTSRGPWQNEVEVLADPRVDGILLPIARELDGAIDQIGAGVYVYPEDDIDKKKLVGLVSGRLSLSNPDGESRDFLTVVGPRDLWRLVTHRRDVHQRRRWIYRPDVM